MYICVIYVRVLERVLVDGEGTWTCPPARYIPHHQHQSLPPPPHHHHQQAYFQTKYGLKLNYPGLHCVRMGSKRKPTFFPIEVRATATVCVYIFMHVEMYIFDIWVYGGRSYQAKTTPSSPHPKINPPQVCKVVAGQRIPNQFVPQVAADIVDLAAIPPANRFNRIYKQVRGVYGSTS